MLDANPESSRAITVDSDSDPDNVILTIAVRSTATFEMTVHKSRFDPFQLFSLIDGLGQTTQ
jgi:hypothetical protein